MGLSLFLFACMPTKLTPENVAKIRQGMKEEEVTSILGKPKEVNSSGMLGITGTTYRYDDGKTQVAIVFINGEVVSKSSSSVR